MQFLELVQLDLIKVPLQAASASEAILELTELLVQQRLLDPLENYAARVISREKVASTHMIPGIAFPHEASVSAPRACMAIGKFPHPTQWHDSEKGNVKTVFLIVLPEANPTIVRVSIMHEIARLFVDENVRQQLDSTTTAADVYALLLQLGASSDIPPGFRLRTILRGHTDVIHTLAWSPQGDRLASGGSRRDECRIWDAQSGQLRAVLRGHAGPLFSVSWSPQGQALVTGCADHILRLWRAGEQFSQRCCVDTHGEIYSVAWSPDSGVLATAGHAHMARLWDGESGAPRLGIQGDFSLGYCVRWSPNGQWLAAGCGRMDPSIRVWNTRTGELVAHREIRNGSVFALAWSPDSHELAIAASDGTILLYQAETWQEVAQLHGHTGQLTAVDFSADGRLLASKADDGTVRLWHVQDRQELAQLVEPGGIYRLFNGLAFHPRRLELATLGEGGRSVRIWQLDYDELLAHSPSRLPHRVRGSSPRVMPPQEKQTDEEYDVFLCHNSQDKAAVMEIGRRLRERGIVPWLDEWAVRPGRSWIMEIQTQLDRIHSAAVFVGTNGYGPWQQQEMLSLIQAFVDRQAPCIPVILGQCVQQPELPPFLRHVKWVDFRKSDPDPIVELIWGVRDTRPM